MTHIGVILAGGRSARMGQDKALLTRDGRRLVDIVHARLSGQCGEILISGPSNYGLKVSSVPDRTGGPEGPAAGIYSVWKRLQARISRADGFFTCPVDVPNIPDDLIHCLSGRESAIARDPKRRHPSIAYWGMNDLENAFSGMDFAQSISLSHLADMCGAREEMWDSQNLFQNINTPNDWTAYLTSHDAPATPRKN